MAASKAIGFLNFKFGADLSGFERGMKKASKKLKKFGKSVAKAGKSLTMNLTLPIVGLGIASVKAFDEQAKAIAQVEAGLKSTGNQVGITSEKLQQMAADLQKTSLFGDEQILSDVTAQLLTFTGIAKEQFGEAQLAVVNLSTKLKTDLKSTAIMVGKALNDPITQLSALSRNGVKFTEEQTLLIKSLVEMGDAAGAQAIILKELEIQFGGSAKAARDAGTGPLEVLMNQLSDLSEQIGERLIPYVQKFSESIVGLAEKFDGLSESTKDNIVFWGLTLAAIGPVLIIIGKTATGIATLLSVLLVIGKAIITFVVPAFAVLYGIMLANPFGAMLAGMSLLAAGIAALVMSNDDATDSTIKLQEETGVLAEAAERAANQLSKLDEVNQSVNKSTKDEIDKVGKLIATIKNGESTRNEQIKALKELKKISPEYFGELKIGVSSLEDIMLATEDYTTSLKDLAKVEFVAAQTKPLYGDLLQAEMALRKFKETAILEFGDPEGDPGAQQMIDSHISHYIYNIEQIQKKIDEYNATLDDVGKTKEKITEETEELVDATKMYSDALETVSTNMLFMASSAEDQFKGILTWTEKLTKAQEAHNATVVLLEDIMFSAAMSAANSQQKFFDSFIENIKKAIKQLLIQLAVLTVIALLLGGPTMTIGKAFGIAKGKMLGLEGFADGGLVYGPTTALIGEGVGTTASNPEVVAPLDKLKQYMGGGNQNIIVEGVLKGNDIYLSNRNTSVNRLRTT